MNEFRYTKEYVRTLGVPEDKIDEYVETMNHLLDHGLIKRDANGQLFPAKPN